MGKETADGLRLIDTDKFFASLAGRLDERPRRLVIAAFADALGTRNVASVARVAGVTRNVVYDGFAELSRPEPELKPGERRRQRIRGGGRKSVLEKDPKICGAIEKIVEPHVRGNPESPLRWISKSLFKIRDVLNSSGHAVSHMTVRKLLRVMGYTLQSCRKSHEHGTHPDRDGQFRHIAGTSASFQSKGKPVISVDTKKKELIGNFKNGGREYHRKGEAPQVEVHDFVTEAGRATPYGVYDIKHDEGFVNVGIGPDTAEFAVESIGKWWKKMGRRRFPAADEIYITCDGGGSNGSHCRLWRKCLQKFANKTGLSVTVSHFPPGTSKWNKIEHRMFSFISTNWRGKPLETAMVIVKLIASTTNKRGLRILSELSSSHYETGVKVSDEEMKTLNIRYNKFHPEWNYTIRPQGR